MILLHCKNYRAEITKLANRPKNIQPEEIKKRGQSCQNCIVALITVQDRDSDSKIVEAASEIIKIKEEVSAEKIVLLPFAHLSNKLADSKQGIELISKLYDEIIKKTDVIKGHFGSHKELLLDLYGHPGNARFREF